MRTLAVDRNNDLFIERGGLAINTDLAATMQLCEHAVKAQYREMVLNYDEGVPTRETIWTSTINVALFEVFIRRAIMSVPNVISIESLDVKIVDNTAFYVAEIKTIYGNGALNNGL